MSQHMLQYHPHHKGITTLLAQCKYSRASYSALYCSIDSVHEEEDLRGVFEMMAYEDQPEILKKDSMFRRRVQKAVAAAISDVTSGKETGGDGGVCCCFGKGVGAEEDKHRPAIHLSPQLQKASSQGFDMMKKVFFPALPHLLQDAWVYLEFGITMFAFIFGLFSLDLNDGSKAFNIVYLTLTIISIVLAVVDCFLYFVQMGSCAECLKICYVKLKRRGEDGEQELLAMEDGEVERKRCCRMSKEKKEKFSTYSELVRNIVSEAILYPLLICDLFDFIVGGVFRNISTEDHLNFTLFVVGGLYLILAVYIMRMFTIAGILFSFHKLPEMPNSSGSRVNNIRLLRWFSVHILFQILTHALLIVSVALKIRHENPVFGEQDSIFASSFLWINVVLGGVIPFAGILSFFVTNYYDIKEFSVSFWIDMMAMLQAPSFTEVVFPSDDGKTSSEMARDFVKDSELKRIKKEYKRYKSPSWYKKFFFPLKLPLHMTIGFLFVFGLFVFLVSLTLTQHPTSPNSPTVETVLFKDMPVTIAFFVCGILLLLFNIRIIVLMLAFSALSAGWIILAGIVLTVSLPVIVCVYIPVCCCTVYAKFWKKASRELSVFSTPGPKINYFTVA